MVVLKRKPQDILTNNFNKKILWLHKANMDIQYCVDEYAVAEYICNYVTKNESGISSLLKNINDEAMEHGEPAVKTIKKTWKSVRQRKGNEYSRVYLQISWFKYDSI